MCVCVCLYVCMCACVCVHVCACVSTCTLQVPALAYQSTLHAIVRTCEEIAADPDGSRQVTVDDMDSSDSVCACC